jgi:hypothetical protein
MTNGAFARSRHVKCDESMNAGREGSLLPAIARAFGSSVIIEMTGRGNRRAIKPLAAALTMQIEFIPPIILRSSHRRGREGTGRHVRLARRFLLFNSRPRPD